LLDHQTLILLSLLAALSDRGPGGEPNKPHHCGVASLSPLLRCLSAAHEQPLRQRLFKISAICLKSRHCGCQSIAFGFSSGLNASARTAVSLSSLRALSIGSKLCSRQPDLRFHPPKTWFSSRCLLNQRRTSNLLNLA